MTKKKASQALQAIPIPQAQVAGAALSVAEKVKEAASRPIFSRHTTKRWDPEAEEWVPFERETELNVTPAAIVAVPVAAVGVAVALFVSGLEATPTSVPVQVPNPEHERWKREGGAEPPSFIGPRPPREAEPPKFINDPSGRTKTRIAVVKRPRSLIRWGRDGGGLPGVEDASIPGAVAGWLIGGPVGGLIGAIFGPRK